MADEHQLTRAVREKADAYRLDQIERELVKLRTIVNALLNAENQPVPEPEKMHRHWFNDVPGRILKAMADGWVPVVENGRVRTKDVGSPEHPMSAILMHREVQLDPTPPSQHPAIRACMALADMWGMPPRSLVLKPKEGTHWSPMGYSAEPRHEIPVHMLMAPAVVAVLKAIREARPTAVTDSSQVEIWHDTIDGLIAVAEGRVAQGASAPYPNTM